jgi:glutathione S-transferase
MTESYQLFQYDSCPFCYRVRQYLNGAGLSIPLRDILRDASARNELMAGGGRTTVPCLRIERGEKVEWLYESRDIIDYLETHSAVS